MRWGGRTRCRRLVGQIRTVCFTSPTFVTFAAHYCSRIRALDSYFCLYKTQEEPGNKISKTQVLEMLLGHVKIVWILSLCYTLAHKPFIHILFHTFIYFQNHRYNLACQLHRSGVFDVPLVVGCSNYSAPTPAFTLSYIHDSPATVLYRKWLDGWNETVIHFYPKLTATSLVLDNNWNLAS